MKTRNKKLDAMALLMAGVFLLTGCASTTMIQSVPENAKVYINGEPVGETPYKHTDDEIIFSTTDIRLEKDGYEPMYGSLSRDEELDAGPVLGGFFFCPVFLLWAFKYHPVHTYEMVPLSGSGDAYVGPAQGSLTDQKADQLRQLKSLLDEGVLTPEEYEREKAKILEE
jgi:hypothetical protein